MNDGQAADMMTNLANMLHESHPKQAEIIGIIGCFTAIFEEEAIIPIWNMAQLFGSAADKILKRRIEEEE